jgi:hypothetical protein
MFGKECELVLIWVMFVISAVENLYHKFHLDPSSVLPVIYQLMCCATPAVNLHSMSSWRGPYLDNGVVHMLLKIII